MDKFTQGFIIGSLVMSFISILLLDSFFAPKQIKTERKKVDTIWIYIKKNKMGELANEMIKGESCSECGIYFVEEHGYPVLCEDCHDKDSELPKAIKEEL